MVGKAELDDAVGQRLHQIDVAGSGDGTNAVDDGLVGDDVGDAVPDRPLVLRHLYADVDPHPLRGVALVLVNADRAGHDEIVDQQAAPRRPGPRRRAGAIRRRGSGGHSRIRSPCGIAQPRC